MKRSLTLLMVATLMVYSLTACGCTAKQAGTKEPVNNGQTDNAVTNDNNTTTDQQNTPNENNHANGGTVTGDLENAGENVIQGAEDVGEAVKDGVEEAGDALTGKSRNSTGGVTYNQMLNNGRVYDTNGNLNDHEAATTTTRAR